MKKILKATAVLVVILFAEIILAPACFAGEAEDSEDIYLEQLKESGAQELFDELPEQTQALLADSEIGLDMSQDISPAAIMESILSIVKDESGNAFASLAAMVGIVILSALVECIADSAGKSAQNTISSITAAALCMAAAVPAAQIISEASAAIDACCTFDMLFIPVYSAICAASGRTVSSMQYSALMIAILEAGSVFIKDIILPLLRGVLAIALTSALSPSLRLSGITAVFEKNLKWLLSFIAVLVAAVMGIGATAGSAMDEVTAKTARFIVSSTVPVLGSAMGDALASVTGCVSLLRTTVGGFGMAAMAFILVPPLIKTALWCLCLNICGAMADILDVKNVKQAVESFGRVLSVVSALLIFTGVLTVFTLAVMIGR